MRRARVSAFQAVLAFAWCVWLSAAAAAPVPEPQGYWMGPIHGPVAATLAGASVIHTRKLAALLKRGDVLVVDVSDAPRRPENLAQQAPWLPLPHPVIPGAIWIPGAGLGSIPADLDQFFRAQLALASGNNLSQRLVIYCHEQCWLSWNAAKRAISYGYRRVYWFPDGMEGWRAAGHATEVAQPQTPP